MLRIKKILYIAVLYIVAPIRLIKRWSFKPNNVRKILIWAAGDGIGDAVNTIPMLRAIRIFMPHARIVVMANNASEFYRLQTEVDEVVPGPHNINRNDVFRWLSYLRKERFDLLIQDPISWERSRFSSVFYSLLCGIRYQVGYFCLSSALCATWVLFFDHNEHTLNMKLRMVEAIIGNRIEPSREIQMLTSSKSSIMKMIQQEKDIGQRFRLIFHTVVKHPTQKMWPFENFKSLAGNLIHTKNAVIFIVGGMDAKEHFDALSSCFGVENVYDFTGLPLDESIELIRCSDLFVGNDSGPMHIASAVGTPVVAVFGPSEVYRNAPYGVGNTAIQANLDCIPCWTWLYDPQRQARFREKRNTCNPPPCMCLVDVNTVFSACISAIERQGKEIIQAKIPSSCWSKSGKHLKYGEKNDSKNY